MFTCPLFYFLLTGRVTCCCSSETLFQLGLNVQERESFRVRAVWKILPIQEKHTRKSRIASQGQRDVNKEKFNPETRSSKQKLESSKVKNTFHVLAFGSAASSFGKQGVLYKSCSDRQCCGSDGDNTTFFHPHIKQHAESSTTFADSLAVSQFRVRNF